jgi:hypothetical protein
VDAAHFRKRAAEARAMAELGHDALLAGSLLEVARDLDAEADVIEAGLPRDRRLSSRARLGGIQVRLRSATPEAAVLDVTLTDLSIGGARLLGETKLPLGASVILELPSCGVQLAGCVARVEPHGVAIAFADDAETVQSADLVLRSITDEPAATRAMTTARSRR